MYHKQGINYTLNQETGKMLSENTTSCHSCTLNFLYFYILENFMAWECFEATILGRHTYNLFSHNLQNAFYSRDSTSALVPTQPPT